MLQFCRDVTILRCRQDLAKRLCRARLANRLFYPSRRRGVLADTCIGLPLSILVESSSHADPSRLTLGLMTRKSTRPRHCNPPPLLSASVLHAASSVDACLLPLLLAIQRLRHSDCARRRRRGRSARPAPLRRAIWPSHRPHPSVSASPPPKSSAPYKKTQTNYAIYV